MDGTIGEYYLATLPPVKGADYFDQVMSKSTGEAGKQEILKFIQENKWVNAKTYHWVNNEWVEALLNV